MNRRLQHFFFVAAAIAGATANAATIDGTFWSVLASTADNVPVLGQTPGPSATEWGTFNASGIQFSGDSNYTLGGFLNSFGAASNIVYMNGADASTNLGDVLFEFTGTASFTQGQTFSVLHDDGINLYIGGNLVLGLPDITSPVTSTYTYTGPTGTQSFDFIYGNGPAWQADFQTTLGGLPVSPAPEPSLLLAIGLVILCLSPAGRRRLAACR